LCQLAIFVSQRPLTLIWRLSDEEGYWQDVMSHDVTLGLNETLEDPPAAFLPLPAAVPRLDYVDGLRALATLWVVLHHVREISSPERTLKLPILGPVLASISFGQAAVISFLVLSGFCLYLPLARRNPDAPLLAQSYRKYLLRRARRIAPPCLWAVFFCLPLAMIPGLRIGRWSEVGPVGFGAIASHLLFVQNLFPEYAQKIDYPLWSVGLEWQLYLIFPILVWAFRKSNGLLVTLGALLLAAAIRGTYRHLPGGLGAFLRDGPFSYLEVFSAGMIVAVLTAQGRRVAPNWLLGAIAAFGLLLVRLGSGNGLVHDLTVTAATASVLLLGINSKWLTRTLSTPLLAKTGVFSYSIYLVHAPLLHLFWLALQPLRLSSDVTFALLAIGCLPVTVAVSYAFHCVFERPFMQSKRALSPSASPASVDAPA
jgi:peptidoglycan/LPS O-acetylase OafA/YrhL